MVLGLNNLIGCEREPIDFNCEYFGYEFIVA